MNNLEILGKSGANPSIIFVMKNSDNSKWYAVQGSTEVKKTYDEITPGMRAETLSLYDYFIWCDPINRIEDLVEAVEFDAPVVTHRMGKH